MFSIPSHRTATGILLLITLISLSPVSSPDAKCADKLNPFNIPAYGVPNEAPNEPEEQLALYWIAREDLGCAANHNDNLKQKINFVRLSGRLLISSQCKEHIRSWLDRIIKVVQHNLLVTLRIKTIQFFQPNEYRAFKNFEFKRQHIASLNMDQIIQVLNKTGQDLKNGLTLIGNDNVPSWESFNEIFSESLRVNQAIIDHADRQEEFNPSSGCDKADIQCLEQLYKALIGKSTDWSGRVLGYTEGRKIVEDGIRVVRAFFLEGASERHHFYELKLPMTPPCFST